MVRPELRRPERSVLVMAGTVDGRVAVRALKESGWRVVATAVTGYGAELAAGAGADQVIARPLDAAGLSAVLLEAGCGALVDATHPYAVEASRQAQQAAREAGVPYLRLERPPTDWPSDPRVLLTADFPSAARLAFDRGAVVYATVGSRRLAPFAEVAFREGKRLVARVLPDPEAISHCLALGLRPFQIMAVQGPFSRELNRLMFKETGAEVLVTKDGGEAGGVLAKVEAALELGLWVVVVRRPVSLDSAVARTPAEVAARLENLVNRGLPIVNQDVSTATAVVVAYHGSRLDQADQTEIEQVVGMLREKLPMLPAGVIKHGALTGGRPDIAEAVEAVIQAGARRIVVLPLFLFYGTHTAHDLPTLLNGLRLRHPGVEILYARRIGADPRIASMLAERLREVMEHATPGPGAD